MVDPEDTPLTNDSSTPPEHTFNIQTVAITLGKVLLGLVFIICSADFSDDFTIGGYLIMGFLGAYLLIDSALDFIPESDVDILINNRFGSIKNNYFIFFYIITLVFIYLVI